MLQHNHLDSGYTHWKDVSVCVCVCVFFLNAFSISLFGELRFRPGKCEM